MGAVESTEGAPRLMGYRKKDAGRLDEYGVLVIRINNLTEKRDNVKIIYPGKGEKNLVVKVNDKQLYSRPLPAEIERGEDSVKYGRRGEVEIKLKKVKPEKWVSSGRWSPTSDNDSS